MAEIELGVFIMLNAIALGGFAATAKWGWGILLILSFVIFSGLALYSFGEFDVVQTKILPAINATRTTVDGDGNTVSVATVDLPETYEKNVWLNSNFNSIGWVYFLAAGLSLTWFLKVIIGMFRSRNKVVAAGYY